jgi:hypothetical protein
VVEEEEGAVVEEEEKELADADVEQEEDPAPVEFFFGFGLFFFFPAPLLAWYSERRYSERSSSFMARSARTRCSS